ncbi:inosine/xanthosine triphosphatase [Methanobacterium spitsbergense]|uniref:Probable inosine/xanthosine triphosphatase n=1 Tax=Methanobacterium spitsbergense TaxID=2874285 RepID=A0A8T5UQA6_9EURY|nr:inosine/xanthosine triphosphatase [Methanobacterium spitsbergense]MBZ2166162.1 inosine/xanthosine triphosphatase [Methanobacterium spitsbergense]
MKVVVGSKNPVKIKATKNILEKIYSDIVVYSVDVDSGVPDQPFGLDETINGAINRAKNAFSVEFNLSVGIESGLMKTPNSLTGYIDLQWCAIFDGNKVTIGVSSGFEYPPEVVKEVLGGVEVGDVMDRITGVEDLGKKKGAVSHLSHDLLNRTENTEQCVLTAMIPRMNEDVYLIHDK